MVELPAPPGGNVQLPNPPHDPPTIDDVSNAVAYTKRVRISTETRLPHSATDLDLARAHVYEVAVSSAVAGGDAAPPWFAQAMQNALQNVFQPTMAPLLRSVNQMYNLQCGDGSSRAFKVVPFPDGSLPHQDPHNLPVLLNVADICNLGGQNARRYLEGYGVHVPTAVVERKRAIGREIGCTDEIVP